LHYEHNKKDGHNKDNFWILHPKLIPKGQSRKRHWKIMKVGGKEGASYVDKKVSLITHLKIVNLDKVPFVRPLFPQSVNITTIGQETMAD
jgi:hypothetical protein